MKKILLILSFVVFALLSYRAEAQVYTFQCVSSPAMTGDSCEGCPVWLIDSRSFDGLVIWEDGLFWRWIEIPYTLKVRGDTIDIWEHTSPPSRLARNYFFPDRVSIRLAQTTFSTMQGFIDSTWCNRPANGTDTTALWHPSDSINVGAVYRGDTLIIVGDVFINVSLDSALNKYKLTLDTTGLGGGGSSQTFVNASDATSHTLTLSGPNGSLQYVEGSGIGLATTGTLLNSILTITNASPDQVVSITGGGINAVTGTYPNFTVTGTEVGTVSSVGLSLPTSVFDITVSPITTSGTLTATLDNQNANTFFRGPNSGGAATPSFGPLVAADLPAGTNLWTDGGATTYLTATGDNVAIGATSAARKVEIIDSGNPQLRLTQTAGSAFTDIFTDASGNTVYSPSGGKMGINGVPSQAALQVNKNSTYNSETTAGIAMLAASSDSEFLLGADGTADICYIQTAQQGASFSNRPLAIQASGGLVGFGLIAPNAKIEVRGTAATSGTYTAIFTNSSGSTATATLALRDDRTVGIRTNAPNRTLEVAGEVRITDLVTDAPTVIVGADADGDLNSITVGTGLTLSAGVLTTTGGAPIVSANNGLSLSGSTVQWGGTLIQNTTIDGATFYDLHKDGRHVFQRYESNPVASANVTAAFDISGITASPQTTSTPGEDAILTLHGYDNGGSTYSQNIISFGNYATTAVGSWIKTRDEDAYNTYYPLNINPNGGKVGIGRNPISNALDAYTTISTSSLSGSTVSGSVLHIDNVEGNAKAVMSFGVGADVLDGEVGFFDAADATRLTNRNTNGTSSIRFAIGGETSDKVIITPTGTGFNSTATTNILSRVQIEGSMGMAIRAPAGATTLDIDDCIVIKTGGAGATWTLPDPDLVGGRFYWLMNHTSNTITLSRNVTSASATTFNTIGPGESAMITAAVGNGWRGFKQISL